MAHLPDVVNPGWPDIFRVETTTPWVGGEEGTANIQPKQIKERTEYLKERADEVDEAKEGQPSLRARMNAIGSSPKSLYKKDFVQDVPIAASTENIELVTGGLLVLDGIQTQAGDLVFLKDQISPVENGFWEVQTGVWNRYDGYRDGGTDCFTQKLIDVSGGDTNRGLIFVIDTDAYVIGETALNFQETYLSTRKKPGTALCRSREGTIDDIIEMFHNLTAHGESRDGRNLLEVFGASTPAEAVAILHERCNNGVSAAQGEPNFTGLLIGDYIDGIDLSAIPAENSGTAGQVWNETYKNNRIVISGFNLYRGAGDTENAKNHIVFTFENCPITKRMNASSINAGGYRDSELRAFLEGTNGDGTGDKSGVTTAAFLRELKAQIGDYVYTIRKSHSIKAGSSWANYTVFPPSEIEIFGCPYYGDEGVYMQAITTPVIDARVGYITNVQFPIFSQSYKHRIKRYNGSRQWWWEQTPYAAGSSSFCAVGHSGITNHYSAASVGGCAPAFCVA